MNAADLLDQFVLEAREGMQVIGQRLLEVERDPGDTERLNDLFRQVHTLKGNCGLFEFRALERIVHAGEDLLDRVRQGRQPYTAEIADALLEAMDYAAELIDAIAADGRLPDAADARAVTLAAALRQHLVNETGAVPGAGAGPAAGGSAASASQAETEPDWAARVPDPQRHVDRIALRYVPESACFFKGEDPWHLARSTPGLQFLDVAAAGPWDVGDGFDCYRCNLDLVIVSDAPLAEVQQHFRYVPEQLQWWTNLQAQTAAAATAASAAATAPGPTASAAELAAARVLDERLARLWADQRALLARPGVAPGSVVAARRVLEHLLDCGGDAAGVANARATARLTPDEAAQRAEQRAAMRQTLQALPAGAAPVAAWAQLHAPGSANVAAPADTGFDAAEASDASGAPEASDPTWVAPLQPRRGSTATGEPGGAENGPSEHGPKVLRVAQDKIDRLMELIGEMVVAKNALPYLALRAEEVFGQRDLAREIKAQYAVVNRIAEDMQHAIMQVRMMPVGTVFQRFGRLVRDLSRKLGKDVKLVIEGEDTEADKHVIEALADPLIHILRNSLDHGIEMPAVRRAAGKPEQGTLKVAARQEGDRVYLDITDDGAGIDTARVRAKAVERGLIPADRADTLTEEEAALLVFLPGFSTKETISDLSGRGVGMDVVRSAVERINGSVALTSVFGKGTTLRLTLPLSMAVTHVMMVEAGGHRFGVPMDLIVETVRVHADDIHRFKQAQTVVLRGRVVPLRALHDLLALDAQPRCNAEGEHAVLVTRLGNETVGLLVDDFDDTSDIILKPLEGVLSGMTGFSGTALMGDGSVLMVLNPKELI